VEARTARPSCVPPAAQSEELLHEIGLVDPKPCGIGRSAQVAPASVLTYTDSESIGDPAAGEAYLPAMA
jgi:hypothetical protein